MLKCECEIFIIGLCVEIWFLEDRFILRDCGNFWVWDLFGKNRDLGIGLKCYR